MMTTDRAYETAARKARDEFIAAVKPWDDQYHAATQAARDAYDAADRPARKAREESQRIARDLGPDKYHTAIATSEAEYTATMRGAVAAYWDAKTDADEAHDSAVAGVKVALNASLEAARALATQKALTAARAAYVAARDNYIDAVKAVCFEGQEGAK